MKSVASPCDEEVPMSWEFLSDAASPCERLRLVAMAGCREFKALLDEMETVRATNSIYSLPPCGLGDRPLAGQGYRIGRRAEQQTPLIPPPKRGRSTAEAKQGGRVGVHL